MQPFETAIGAKCFATSEPAENIAKSKPSSKEVSVSSFTTYSLSLNFILLPADFSEAKNTILERGKLNSSNTFIAVLPTKPVAPTKAKLYFFI